MAGAYKEDYKMYRQCTTEKTAMQQRIIQDALLSVMEVKAYTEISVTELCALSKLTRKIFYRLFDCKDDVLQSLLDRHFYECNQFISGKTIESSFLQFFTFWKQHKAFLDLLEKNQLSGQLMAQAFFYTYSIDKSVQQWIGAESSRYGPEILMFFISGLISLVITWHHSKFIRSTEEMAEIAVHLYTQGLLQ